MYQDAKEPAVTPSTESGSLDSSKIIGVMEPAYDDPKPRGSIPRRIWDSFQRDPNRSTSSTGAGGGHGKEYDVEAAAQATAHSPLARELNGRHLQMIAIGGSIGKGHCEPDLVLYSPISQEPVSSLPPERHCRMAVLRRC